MLIVLIVLILVFGLGGGYVGHRNYGGYSGPGFGIGTVLLIVILLYLLGYLPRIGV